MKLRTIGFLSAVVLLAACGGNKEDSSADRMIPDQDPVTKVEVKMDSASGHVDTLDIPEDTSTLPVKQPVGLENTAFRNISLKRISHSKFQVSGEARVFEATYNWSIEDGHNELASGFGTSSAGAPAWGKFSFVVDAKKDQENTKIHLSLFEMSAKDGSRVNELPILLY